jgi:hypothetical protein
MSMGRRDNRPYCAAYELACMICEQRNPDYPNECQAPEPCHFYLAFSSHQLPCRGSLFWCHIFGRILLLIVFFTLQNMLTPNKVVSKVRRLEGENGQFRHNRASNA